MRGVADFAWGETFDVGGPLVPGSPMTGFVLFSPIVLAREDATVEVGDDLPISITGCYPLHPTELAFVREHGLEPLWRDPAWDPLDLSRTPNPSATR